VSRLSRAADRFRRAVLAREEQAATILVDRYATAYQILSAQLDELTAKAIQLQAEGKEITRDLIYRRTRLQELLNQIEAQVEDFAQYAEAHVANEQRVAIDTAQANSRSLVVESLGPLPEGVGIPTNFLRFNPLAVEKFLGRASNGSPLRDLFATLAAGSDDIPGTVAQFENIFVQGLIKGANPREIARQLRNELQVPLHRALTISRTEVLNSYRETSREFYEQNDDVVVGWRWQAAFNARTCAMCLAMDGQIFKTQISLYTHPNCRCTLVPVTKTWAELGFDVPERRSRPSQDGQEWFAKQDEKTKLRILGPAKLLRYNEGKLTLRDLVGVRSDPAWGKSRHERSLKSIEAGSYVPTRRDWGRLSRKT
jgi:SPP1 gp7 family putative phage head morphogenesis protein